MIKWRETEERFRTTVGNKTNKELRDIIMNSLAVPHFKCHSQIVEQAVKKLQKQPIRLLEGQDFIATVQ